MSLWRWLITVVAFPLAGLAAIHVASTTAGPLSAALAGAIAGIIVGSAQWLALRPRVGLVWIAVTAAALAVGSALASVVVGSSSSIASLAIGGAISGALIGITQGAVLRGGIRVLVLWTLVVAASWTAAWTITGLVIVDEERGFATFGLSGAAIATLATGLALRGLLGARAHGPADRPASHGEVAA